MSNNIDLFLNCDILNFVRKDIRVYFVLCPTRNERNERFMTIRGFIKKKPSLVTVLIFVLCFALWYTYMSITTDRTNYMEKRIKNSLNIGLYNVEYTAPRMHLTNDGGFYAPEVNSPDNQCIENGKIYDTVLEDVQNFDVPYCKIQQGTLQYIYPNLSDGVLVEFYVLPFIKKTIYVKSTLQPPKFKNPVGSAIK